MCNSGFLVGELFKVVKTDLIPSYFEFNMVTNLYEIVIIIPAALYYYYNEWYIASLASAPGTLNIVNIIKQVSNCKDKKGYVMCIATQSLQNL